VQQHLYAQQIGSLMYITKQSRRDIAFAVNKLSRCTSNPNKIIALHQKECLNTYEAQLTIIIV